MVSAENRVKEIQKDVVRISRMATRLKNRRFSGTVVLQYRQGRLVGQHLVSHDDQGEDDR